MAAHLGDGRNGALLNVRPRNVRPSPPPLPSPPVVLAELVIHRVHRVTPLPPRLRGQTMLLHPSRSGAVSNQGTCGKRPEHRNRWGPTETHRNPRNRRRPHARSCTCYWCPYPFYAGLCYKKSRFVELPAYRRQKVAAASSDGILRVHRRAPGLKRGIMHQNSDT